MILEVQGVSFSFKSRSILNNITFSVTGGELLAILGPNGVGKTTLLKCINSIIRPSDGAVQVESADVLKLSPEQIAKSVAYVAQKTDASRLTVFDAVLMGRKPHIRWKVSQDDLKLVNAILTKLDMDHLSLRYMDSLSGGELQKVSIARSMVQNPRLLLLDEPTSALDLKNQIAILTMLRNVVTNHNIAAIMTMHDLNAALRYAHKFIFLKNGRIHAAGPINSLNAEMIEAVYGLPVEVYHHHGHPLVIPHCEHFKSEGCVA
jgi:iron complex transport system ATP-binding protein